MTRQPPKPLWRSLGRYGDDGPWLMALPMALAERYKATAHMGRDRRALTAVSVVDRESGATFEWRSRGDRITTSHASDATAASRDRLWRDGRDIIGLARRQSGGPASGTGVSVDDLISVAIRLRTPDGWPTEEAAAEEVGRSVRTVRRIGETLPGPGDPYEKVLARAAARLRHP